MILNDVRKDIMKMLIDEDKYLIDLSREMGDKTRQALHYALNVADTRGGLRPKVVTALEFLGYDIKIEYVKREEKESG